MRYKGIVITDFDGTLLKNDQQICEKDIDTLHILREQNYCRTIATGRSLFSIQKIIGQDFPIDYIIFSTGAGIINWKTKEIFYKQSIKKEVYKEAFDLLKAYKIDFMLHKAIPENHHFLFYTFNESNSDFWNRVELYGKYAIKGNGFESAYDEASQLIAISDDASKYEKVKQELDNLKVIRATSPLNHKSTWIEIFNPNVSKGITAKWLWNFLQIPKASSLGIGNDYNDFDLLEETEYSFVVDNAPTELKSKYQNTKSNDENGFSNAVFQSFGIK